MRCFNVISQFYVIQEGALTHRASNLVFCIILVFFTMFFNIGKIFYLLMLKLTQFSRAVVELAFSRSFMFKHATDFEEGALFLVVVVVTIGSTCVFMILDVVWPI